ncbi:hypothetical protein FO440_14555 [Mucilaginibacter corticis]|uniref:Uncharacterized protein n=1 Tax=Mucilaginibacter corticis TaxID=2597670 RepID=A0A556MLZ7_9SPHI|nr:hypothetical protein [Mucilaginibacter corticis]TSJ40954.1 hypothetical protein FO440_14555 [Mucilaginibacter corticis]
MNEIKSLADQLRNNIHQQGKPPPEPEILEKIRKYDNRDHKSLMHIRFDRDTLKLLGQFKMATGVDVTKLVAFSVHQLLEQHPEIKTLVKHYIQQLNL